MTLENAAAAGLPSKINDPVKIWKRVRYLVTVLIMLGVAMSFVMRIDMSIAIVAMTDKNGSNPNFEEFDWNPNTQSIILSSFFVGYVVANVPAGMVLQQYGARWILLASLALCSILTFIIPIVTSKLGYIALCVVRVLQGAAQGAVFPSLHVLMPKWAPSHERVALTSVAFAGIQIGNIIALPVSGVLASSSGGWPSIFYAFGGMGIAWCIVWFFWGTDSPAQHPLISKDENGFIDEHVSKIKKSNITKVPWLDIATSLPMWAIAVSHCVQNWGFYMLLTEMPTYMKNILKYDIKENGMLTALPYLAMLVLIFIISALADWLNKRKITSVAVNRKLFNSLGFLGPMCTMIGLTFMGEEDTTIAVVLLVLSCGINAGIYAGFQINHVDLSPNFAGVLLGITNAMAGIVSLIVPLIVGAITYEKYNVKQWQLVFWITAGIYLFGSVVFVVFGSTEIQSWNKVEDNDEKVEENS